MLLRTVLNRNKRWWLAFFLSLLSGFWSSTSEVTYCGLLVNAHFYAEEVPIYSTLSEGLTLKGHCILSNVFTASIKVIMSSPRTCHSLDVLSYILLMYSDTLPVCGHSVWSQCMTIWRRIPLPVFTESFCISIHRRYWWVGVSVLLISLSGSDMRLMFNSSNDLHSVPPSFPLENDVNYSLSCRTYQSYHLLWAFLGCKFFFFHSTSSLAHLWHFSFLNLEIYINLENFHFILFV